MAIKRCKRCNRSAGKPHSAKCWTRPSNTDKPDITPEELRALTLFSKTT